MGAWALHATRRGQRLGMGDLLLTALAAELEAPPGSKSVDFVRMADPGFVKLHRPQG